MNNIEEKLNAALAEAQERAFVNAFASKAIVVGGSLNYSPINIAFQGLSGIGKTSIIRQWAKDHAEEINFIERDAALLTVNLIGGAPVVFSTYEVERMSRPDTVLFIDNYHLIRKDVEQQINRLLKDRLVVDVTSPSGTRVLANILFVVIAITT